MKAKEALPLLESIFTGLDNDLEKGKFVKLLPSIVGVGVFAEKSAEFSQKVSKAEAFLDNKWEEPTIKRKRKTIKITKRG